MDNYYLNNAVYLVEEFLKRRRIRRPTAWSTTAIAPSTAGTATTTRSNAYSRLRYPQMVLPWALERILTTAPAGADLRSWRY